jgi:hypothetical protein
MCALNVLQRADSVIGMAKRPTRKPHGAKKRAGGPSPGQHVRCDRHDPDSGFADMRRRSPAREKPAREERIVTGLYGPPLRTGKTCLHIGVRHNHGAPGRDRPGVTITRGLLPYHPPGEPARCGLPTPIPRSAVPSAPLWAGARSAQWQTCRDPRSRWVPTVR